MTSFSPSSATASMASTAKMEASNDWLSSPAGAQRGARPTLPDARRRRAYRILSVVFSALRTGHRPRSGRGEGASLDDRFDVGIWRDVGGALGDGATCRPGAQRRLAASAP